MRRRTLYIYMAFVHTHPQ